MAYIEFRNVHKSFGNNEVLKGINLSIDEENLSLFSVPPAVEKVRFSAVFQAWRPLRKEKFIWTELTSQILLPNREKSAWFSSSTVCSPI